jgi:hypothetical protein
MRTRRALAFLRQNILPVLLISLLVTVPCFLPQEKSKPVPSQVTLTRRGLPF